MKTAISVLDELFERAETAAQRLNMSRSQLYVTAVYSTESSELDPVLHQMQIATLIYEQSEIGRGTGQREA